MAKEQHDDWPWIDLEAEFLTSPIKKFPSVIDFLTAKGISKNTGYRHTIGWQDKRNVILQNATKKAIVRYENTVARIIAKQGNIVDTIIDAAFMELIKTDSKGKPLLPLRFKGGKGKEISPAVVQRLLMPSMSIQHRLAAVEGSSADRTADQAPFKTVSDGMGGEVEVTTNVSQKLNTIRKNPKLLKQAEAMIEALGKNSGQE